MSTGLDSAAAKIIRAEEHLDAINRIIRHITAGTGSHDVIKDSNGKETIHFLIEPPIDIAILAGEIVYQLRSTLDHLAFDLVKLNPTRITLPVDWERNCSFPLWLTIPKKPPISTCFNNSLPGVSKPALAFIESLQPYRAGEGHHNVLAIITKLCNIDKHRYLNVVWQRAAVRQETISSRGLYSSFTLGGLKHGAEVQPITTTRGPDDPIVQVKRSFLPYITFDEMAIGAGPASLESQQILELCVETVKNIVVPAFIQLLKNP